MEIALGWRIAFNFDCIDPKIELCHGKIYTCAGRASRRIRETKHSVRATGANLCGQWTRVDWLLSGRVRPLREGRHDLPTIAHVLRNAERMAGALNWSARQRAARFQVARARFETKTGANVVLASCPRRVPNAIALHFPGNA